MYKFEETQRFRQWWIWAILIFAIGTGIYTAMHVVGKGDVVVAIGLAGPVLVGILMFSIKLETKVDGGGVHYRFFPIQIGMRIVAWDELETAGVRKYCPIGEFGGWGYRFTFGKRGKALNIAGNMGLQLVFKDGNKLLIGTRKPEELIRVLHDLGKG